MDFTKLPEPEYNFIDGICKGLILRVKDILAIVIVAVLFLCAYNNLKSSLSLLNKIEKTKQALMNASKCEKLLFDNACRASLKCINSLDSETLNTSHIRLVKASALFCVGDFEEAEKGFKYYIKNAPEGDENKEYAKKYLAKVAHAKRLIRHDIGDYFVELDKVAVWKNPRTLKVYISDDFNKKQLLYKAFAKWDDSLDNMVNFYYTNDVSEANITAKAVRREALSEAKRIGETYTSYTYRVDRPEIKYINKADVSVAVNFNQDVLLEDEEFYSVALHEIGHALGILSHSPSMGDAMYPSTDSYANARVSKRDVNTVKRLYGNI